MSKIKTGTYRIMENHFNQGEPKSVLIGRIMVHNGQMKTLEDHSGLISDSLTEGPMSDAHDKFLNQLDQSPYFKLISEQHINEGLHEDLVDEVKWEDSEPEARYLLFGDDEPKRVEMYGDVMVVDGQRLSDDESKALVEEIRKERYRLVPI